jgi:hypothetical protein
MRLPGQKLFHIFFICLLAALLGACNFAPYQGQAQIVLDLGWLFPSGGGTAEGARSGSVSGANTPLNIAGYVTSIEITVSGAGINTTTRTYTKWPDRLSVTVEPGKERTIGVRINISPASDSAVLAFGGEGTIKYISAGQQAKVVIQLSPVETKIVVPDALNQTVAQFNSLPFKPQTFKTFTSGTMQPYDIAFDSAGKIWIADHFSETSNIRIIDIVDSKPTTQNTINMNLGSQSTAIAADYKTKYMYCAANANISRIVFDLSLPVEGPKSIPNVSNITGMDVDENGLLYLVATYTGKQPAPGKNIIRYNFNTGDFFIEPLPASALDVVIRGDYLYITCSTDYKIQRYNKNTLTLSFENGTFADPPTNPGEFNGPKRFLTVDEDRFYIIDEAGTNDRIVSFTDITNWSGWETLDADLNPLIVYTFQFYE